MAIPSGLTSVQIRGRFLHVDGSPAAGYVTFTPMRSTVSGSLNLIVVATPVRVKLDLNGSFTVTVVAGDDPDLEGELYLKIDEQVEKRTRSYTILVTEQMASTGLDLADAVPVEPVAEMTAYVKLSSVGASNGVAPLGADGVVPTAFLPPASGGVGVTDHGALTGLADDDHTQYLTTSRGDVRYATPTTVASAVTDHQLAGDPHPTYLTQAEGDGLYAPTTHATRHASGGSDPVTPSSIGAAQYGAIYPLIGRGYHSATCDPITTTVQSTFSSWKSRIWVPAGEPIEKVAMVVTVAGVLGVGGLNAFCLYEDDGVTKLGRTPNDNGFWTGVDERVAFFVSMIPAASFGRFVQLLTNIDGYSSAPSVPYAVPTGSAGPTINGTGPHQERSAFRSPYTGDFPTSIDPNVVGTPTNFVPFIMLG